MPGGDRTGPLGLGAMTGRAAGYCAGYGMPGFANGIYGRGFWGWGRGRGGGRGRGRWYPVRGFTAWSPVGLGWPAVAPPWPAATYTPAPVPAMTLQQEIDALKGQAAYLAEILEGVRRRVEELEPKTAQVKARG